MPDDFELDVDALFAEAEEHVPTTNVEDEKAAALAEAARTLAPAQVAQAAEVTTSSDTPTRAEFNEVLRITKQNEQRLDRILANSEQLLRQLQVSKPQTAEEPPEVAEVPVDASGEVDIAGMFGETETPKPATRRRSPKK
jgi:uncharacterized membrane protein YccC